MTTTIYFCRKTGECFVASDSRSCRFLERELFESGRRNRADFETANTSGFIKVQQQGIRLDVTTFDDPDVL